MLVVARSHLHTHWSLIYISKCSQRTWSSPFFFSSLLTCCRMSEYLRHTGHFLLFFVPFWRRPSTAWTRSTKLIVNDSICLQAGRGSVLCGVRFLNILAPSFLWHQSGQGQRQTKGLASSKSHPAVILVYELGYSLLELSLHQSVSLVGSPFLFHPLIHLQESQLLLYTYFNSAEGRMKWGHSTEVEKWQRHCVLCRRSLFSQKE